MTKHIFAGVGWSFLGLECSYEFVFREGRLGAGVAGSCVCEGADLYPKPIIPYALELRVSKLSFLTPQPYTVYPPLNSKPPPKPSPLSLAFCGVVGCSREPPCRVVRFAWPYYSMRVGFLKKR